MRTWLTLVAAVVVVALGVSTEEIQSASSYKLYLPIVFKPGGAPTPSPSPTPTPVSTSSPTPAPTATPIPGTVDVLNVAQRSSSSYVYITGEVQNNTGGSIYDVEIAVTFYNADGTVAGSTCGYAYYYWVPNRTRAPFVLITSPQAGWSWYKLSTSWDTGSYIAYNHNFSIMNTNAYWSGSVYYVVGEIRNDTAYTWQFVRPVVTVYDSSGRVIDAEDTYVASTNLAPGQTSSFSTMFFGSHLAAMAR